MFLSTKLQVFVKDLNVWSHLCFSTNIRSFLAPSLMNVWSSVRLMTSFLKRFCRFHLSAAFLVLVPFWCQKFLVTWRMQTVLVVDVSGNPSPWRRGVAWPSFTSSSKTLLFKVLKPLPAVTQPLKAIRPGNRSEHATFLKKRPAMPSHVLWRGRGRRGGSVYLFSGVTESVWHQNKGSLKLTGMWFN